MCTFCGRPAGRPDRRRDELYRWQPFGPGVDGRFKPHWWERAGDWPTRGGWFFLVRLDGVEVARVKLDDNGVTASGYGAPALDRAHGGLQIERFEVVPDRWRRGVGTATVHTLAALLAGRRLAAFAIDDEAEDFWRSLGWERYDCEGEPPRSYPLFVQPLGR